MSNTTFGAPVSSGQTTRCDEVLKPKELPMDEAQYFVFLETQTGLGQKGDGTLHVFHRITDQEKLTYDESKKVGIWGCTALNGNLENIKSGQAIMLTLLPTPEGKRWINTEVRPGPQVIEII